MNRRTFLCWLTMGTLSASVATGAQYTTGKMPLIGVLLPAEPESPTEPNAAAFRQGLRDLGYVEGRTVAVEYRYAHGRAELYSRLATELVRLNVEIIIVGSAQATQAASRATQTIPIVFVGIGDPVGIGLVATLARPGGNITGPSSAVGSGFAGKWVELLKEAAPTISRVGYLRDPSNPVTRRLLPDVQIATQALGLELLDLELRDVKQLDRMLAEINKKPGTALITFGEPLIYAHRSRITDLTVKYRLPTIYGLRVFVDAGGLMSYGPSLPAIWGRAATYVAKILKGAKPADLPVEQPTKFELVINLKTAKALGLTIPPSVLGRADQVIQ
jgi:ABC-type uncharacterized transport system substrate-binding protein